jgi:DNA-binding transcriptional LysR family regulator
MTTKLPPLNSLRAFASAAKHKSFTRAALELNVTQGAISKQIAILENYLGLNLFERKHQSLLLTKPAEKYLEAIDTALKIVEQATTKLTNKTSKELITISILPSLSNQWLMPRLEEFKSLHPYYKISMLIGDGHVDFDKRDDVDFSIRIARKNSWPNFCVVKMWAEKLVCVCSPKLKAKHQIRSIHDLLNQNLLLHTSRPETWQNYLKFHRVKKTEINFNDGFQHFFMLLKAAKDGLGIALIPDFLIENELENGSLVKVFADIFKSGYSYYLISPKQKSHLQKIEDFKSWILPKPLKT